MKWKSRSHTKKREKGRGHRMKLTLISLYMNDVTAAPQQNGNAHKTTGVFIIGIELELVLMVYLYTLLLLSCKECLFSLVLCQTVLCFTKFILKYIMHCFACPTSFIRFIMKYIFVKYIFNVIKIDIYH